MNNSTYKLPRTELLIEPDDKSLSKIENRNFCDQAEPFKAFERTPKRKGRTMKLLNLPSCLGWATILLLLQAVTKVKSSEKSEL